MGLTEHLQKYTYEYLLQLALSQVSSDVDKREGSIIYDALAPACYILAEYFAEHYRLAQEVSIETSSGEWLDAKAMELGLTRNQATAAQKKATFLREDGSPATVPIGSRFSTISTSEPIYYIITGTYPEGQAPVPGEYIATCESVGTIGQQYFGNIVPLSFVEGVAVATLGETLIPGTDTETDDELRERYLTKVNNRPFAGNIAHYKEIALGIVGVDGVQVYPTWNGGGTVKLSVVDSNYEPVSDDFLATVQQAIDPDAIEGSSGMGLGLAPIDHRVTVVTPEEYVVNIVATIKLKNSYTLDQVKPQIETALASYFTALRREWDVGSDMNEYSMTVYRSNIIASIISVTGVATVDTNTVTINELLEDIPLREDGELQQIPTLGEVVVSVAT